MSELTSQEVCSLILSDVQDPQDGDWDFWNNAGYSEKFLNRDVPGVGNIEVIESQMSDVEPVDEFNGNYTEWKIWVVFRIPDGRLFRVSGSTDSWGASPGLNYVEEVEAVEKVITVWETKHDY